MLFILELIHGLLNVFLCFHFLSRCFCRKGINRLREISMFAAIVLLSMCARSVENNLVNLLLSFISLILMTFVYEISWTERLMSAAFMFSASAISDFVAYVMIGLIFSEEGAGLMRHMPARVSEHMICLALVYLSLCLGTCIFKEHEEYSGYQPRCLRWIMLLIPFAYLVMGNTVLCSEQGVVWNSAVASWPLLIALLFLYFLILYFYQTLLRFGKRRAEQMALECMEEHYRREISLLQQQQDKVRTMKYDIKNHLISLKQLIELENYEESKAYIDGMVPELGMIKTIHTGNSMIDGILNSKIYLAKQSNIPIHTDINIPPDLNMSCKGITIILGTLLDHALDACMKAPADKRSIRIKMFWLHHVLTVEVVNTYMGVIRKQGEHFLTDKPEEGHGLGLASISRAVDQYSGKLEISHHETLPDGTKLFRVRILLYLDTLLPCDRIGETHETNVCNDNHGDGNSLPRGSVQQRDDAK